MIRFPMAGVTCFMFCCLALFLQSSFVSGDRVDFYEIVINDRTLHFYNGAEQFMDADKKCKDILGTSFAVFKPTVNEEVVQIADYIGKQKQVPAWLIPHSTTKDNGKVKYSWIKETVSGDLWREGQPKGDGECLAVDRKELFETVCTGKNSFLCEVGSAAMKTQTTIFTWKVAVSVIVFGFFF